MYLFVFVFLVIGLLGVYTQVFAVQTAKIFASQAGVAQMMVAWHSGEVSLGKNVVHPTPASVCSLTYGMTAAPYCKTDIAGNLPPLPANVTQNTSLGAIGAYVDATGNPYPHLAKGYNVIYAWNSILFPDASGQLYVVTWAPLPASGKASDVITAPPIGISSAELFQQLHNANTTLIGYGAVNGGVLKTAASTGSGPVTFTMPPGNIVPDGSVALISLP